MSLRAKLRGVPDWEAFLRWKEYAPLIQKVLDRGDHEWTADDILEDINQSNKQLWSFEGDEILAVAVTQISKYPKKKYCEFVMAASSRPMGAQFWRDMRDLIIPWAKQHGCTAIKITGRKGWGRVFQMEPACTVFKRDI